jgi:hypothetical protein
MKKSLQNTGAVMMTDNQMQNVRGEFYSYEDYRSLKSFISGLGSGARLTPISVASAAGIDIVSNNGRGMFFVIVSIIDYYRGDNHGYNWLNSRGYWD